MPVYTTAFQRDDDATLYDMYSGDLTKPDDDRYSGTATARELHEYVQDEVRSRGFTTVKVVEAC